MKGELVKSAAIALLCSVGMMSTISARAEHVQADTPWYSGVPLQSLVKGQAGGTINSTQLVWGTSLTVNSLAATGPGAVTVRLTDIQWPQALQSVSVLVTDLNNFWQKIDGPTDPNGLMFNLNGAANLFVAVFARSQDKYSPGVYHLQASFAPAVPLPAAVWLLLSGVGGLAAFRRKR